MKIKKLKRANESIIGLGVCVGVNGQEVVIVAGDTHTLETIWRKLYPSGKVPKPLKPELLKNVRVSTA